jgi:hypothetical protein
LEYGAHHAEQRPGGCDQRDVPVVDVEAARLDPAVDVAGGVGTEGRGSEVVADLEAHEQPSPFGLLRGAPDQRAVRDCDDLGRVVEHAGRCVDRLAGGLRGLLHDRGDDRVLALEIVCRRSRSRRRPRR